ncbi:MAG: ABC-2 family transporter protein [Dehalococcoidales bacterium]|nr:MAG: ABC-2 family transporter protein [Dehalococcoidales bacterium]
MKAYLTILRMRFAVQLQYRAAAAAAFFTQLFFGFVRVMVFQAFYASTTSVQPISLEQVVTYTWIVQVTFRMQPWSGDNDIIDMIRDGNVAYELCRPLDLYLNWYCRLISQRIVPAMLTGIPLFLLVLLLPEGFGPKLPASPAAGAAWFISMGFALLLGCAIGNLMTLSTLWTLAGYGMQRIVPALVMVFSGSIVPLVYYPDWAQDILKYTPFSGLVEIPLRFYLEVLPVSKLLPFILLQCGWTLVFIITGILILKAGMRRVVVQGG